MNYNLKSSVNFLPAKKDLMFPASAEFIHKLATGQNNWP